MSEPKVKVKLACARAGHVLDAQGRVTGVFAQQAGDVVEMGAAEAQRHLDRALATPAPAEPAPARK